MVTSPKKAAFSWQAVFIPFSVPVSGDSVGVGGGGSEVLVGIPPETFSEIVVVGLATTGGGPSLGVDVAEAVSLLSREGVGVAESVTVAVTFT